MNISALEAQGQAAHPERRVTLRAERVRKDFWGDFMTDLAPIAGGMAAPGQIAKLGGLI